jgi:hypothetical protein
MVLKKLEVPEELPNLEFGDFGEDGAAPVRDEVRPGENFASNIIRQSPASMADVPETEFDGQNSFFQDMLEKLETNDMSQIEGINNDSRDFLDEMKEYWSKQNSSLMSAPARELKKRLLDRIHLLRTLEKEWQESYFNMLEKEEMIKIEEASLKDDLQEFVRLWKMSGKGS